MGKIRVKTIGDETLEEEQKKEASLAREARQAKQKKEAKKLTKAPGSKGGERVVAVGPSEEEIAKELETAKEAPKEEKVSEVSKASKAGKPKKAKFVKKRVRSQKYQAVAKLIDRNKIYSLTEALEILPKLKLSNFDETVELHINMTEQGISGQVSLPHGTGKQTKVAIADDKLIAEIEKGLPRGKAGKIDFDVLLSTPAMMPKLARVAKFLGPRGLMPNPKNGTITNDPEKEAEKYKGGFLSFKTEAKAPIIHLIVGKLSFGEKKLLENIKTIFAAIPSTKIKSAILKSTMSPGIKIDFIRV
jgi:large subunit ribosomal protein L1